MSETSLPLGKWRLILDSPSPGVWNMAVDEAILEAAAAGEQPPTLRLYAWAPPCLSLGYAQAAADVDFDALHNRGWDLVRRPTGGRAILHTDELTYAVIGPINEPRLAGSVLESYRRLSEALLLALRQLGLPVQASPLPQSPPDAAKGPVCFEEPSNYEITVEGKKLVGSAQSRRLGGLLQHGSIPLTGDLGRITQVLNFSNGIEREKAAARLYVRAATAEEILGARLSWEKASQELVAAFEQILSIRFVPGQLSEAERLRAAVLVQEKYAAPSWTKRI